MAYSKSASKKAAKTMLKRDPDFYRRIGAMGGKKSTKGGFYTMSREEPYRFKEISSKGGNARWRGKNGG